MSTAGNMPALLAEGVGFAYGRHTALTAVGFTVPAGRFTALVGPNGAGKSTLFALATGLMRPSSGRLAVLGHDLGRRPGPALARLGVVFQQPTLDLDLTVSRNLAYFAALHGLSAAETRTRTAAVLERLDLTALARRPARALSGGQRRRVEIARALLHRPALLLLDEPTVGLDVPSRREVLAHVRALAREDGVAVLWATHLIDEIDPAADRLVVLSAGRVRAEGEAAALVGAEGSISAAYDRLTSDRLTGGEPACPAG